MPRRYSYNNDNSVEEPPKKKVCCIPSAPASSFKLRHGEFLTDLAGKQWKLGKTVGAGGFGEIYSASDDLNKEVKTECSPYVAKVESHSNGPLFVEVNCYLRIAKQDQIEAWKKEKRLKHLGMPHYVSSGSHCHKAEKYRFLILPRFQTDLERILQDKKKLNLKTVLNISCQILDVLEYIHGKGYIHSDVKASNILLGNIHDSCNNQFQKREEDSDHSSTTSSITNYNNNAHNNTKKKYQKSLKSSPVKRRRLRRIRQQMGCANPMRACKSKLMRYGGMRTRSGVVHVTQRINRNLRPAKYYAVDYTDDLFDSDSSSSAYDDDGDENDFDYDGDDGDDCHWENTYVRRHRYDETEGQQLPTTAETPNNNSTDNNRHQVYLFDYGLACKYLSSNGEHKPFCVDERKAHAGTILFCSRDAHNGVPSRRSDLESLGYNMIYWLTETLPWSKDVDDPEIVAKKKQRAFLDPDRFLRECFGQYPMFLMDYFQFLQKLQFQERPDYSYCKKLFRQTLREFGYKDDSRFDFDNVEGWGRSNYNNHNNKKQKLNNRRRLGENLHYHGIMAPPQKIVYKISRPPLQSNNITPIKPLLRRNKKTNNKLTGGKNKVRWSQILIDNPEIIIKQAREKRHQIDGAGGGGGMEGDLGLGSSSIADMDIHRLNPTATMLEVFNKCKERVDRSPTYKGDSSFDNLDGYTPAMMSVYKRMLERRELEYEMLWGGGGGGGGNDSGRKRNNNILSTTKWTSTSYSKKSNSSKRNNNDSSRKLESPEWLPPVTRTAKSATTVMKKQLVRKLKGIPPRRTYSLRG